MSQSCLAEKPWGPLLEKIPSQLSPQETHRVRNRKVRRNYQLNMLRSRALTLSATALARLVLHHLPLHSFAPDMDRTAFRSLTNPLSGLSLRRLIDGNNCGRDASSSRALMVTPSSRGIDRRIADDRGDQGTEHGTGWSRIEIRIRQQCRSAAS